MVKSLTLIEQRDGQRTIIIFGEGGEEKVIDNTF